MSEIINYAPSLSQVPGVAGWHRSSGRAVIRLNDGTAFTAGLDSTPHSLREEAKRLRFKAEALTALAYDIESEGVVLKND